MSWHVEFTAKTKTGAQARVAKERHTNHSLPQYAAAALEEQIQKMDLGEGEHLYCKSTGHADQSYGSLQQEVRKLAHHE